MVDIYCCKIDFNRLVHNYYIPTKKNTKTITLIKPIELIKAKFTRLGHIKWHHLNPYNNNNHQRTTHNDHLFKNSTAGLTSSATPTNRRPNAQFFSSSKPVRRSLNNTLQEDLQASLRDPPRSPRSHRISPRARTSTPTSGRPPLSRARHPSRGAALDHRRISSSSGRSRPQVNLGRPCSTGREAKRWIPRMARLEEAMRTSKWRVNRKKGR